jgi:hypothetical protein
MSWSSIIREDKPRIPPPSRTSRRRSFPGIANKPLLEPSAVQLGNDRSRRYSTTMITRLQDNAFYNALNALKSHRNIEILPQFIYHAEALPNSVV